MSYYNDASLVLLAQDLGKKAGSVAAQKPMDANGQMTFTRTGDTATRVNSAGLIEKVRTNLLQQSQNLAAAAWSTGGTATRTANYGIAPDGTQTSTRIQWTAAASFELYQYTGFAVPVYGSVYIKGTNGQTIKYTGNSVTLNGSWQRIEGAIAIDGANTYFTISGTAGTNTAFDFQLWGAQAERGDIATDYIPTTTAAVSVGPVANVPRLDYLNSTCPRLLLEPQRTNLAIYSEQFNNAAWGKNGASVTANTATSPDGFTNADTLEKAGGSGGTSFYYVVASVTSNTTNTFSVFAKYKEGSGIIWLLGKNSGTFAYFNLQTGTALSATAGMTTKIENYGNGWYRCSFTQDYTGASDYTFGVGLCLVAGTPNYDATSAATQGAYIYGAQFEAGAYATSYIPTLGAAVTRGADACSKTGISSLIGQTEGWIYGEVEGLTNSYGSKSVILSVNDGSSLNRVELSFNPTTGYITPRIYKAGNTIFVNDYFKDSLTTKFKFAVGYGAGRAVFYVNGTKIHEVTSLTFFTSGTLTKVSADNYNGGEAGFGRVSTYLIGTSNLTNAQLAELTAL